MVRTYVSSVRGSQRTTTEIHTRVLVGARSGVLSLRPSARLFVRSFVRSCAHLQTKVVEFAATPRTHAPGTRPRMQDLTAATI